jgi:hypothetical protein
MEAIAKVGEQMNLESPAKVEGMQEAYSRRSGSPLTDAFFILALTGLFLLPAALNGFPFVMEDSIAYSGEGTNWMRPAFAAVLASPLYHLIGYWSLTVIMALLSAVAWVSFCSEFNCRRWLPLAVPLAVLSLQPVYTSAVLVDGLFFPAIVFMILAIRRKSPAFALVAGCLLSSHGSGVPLAAALTLVAAILLKSRTALIFGGLTVLVAVGVGMALHAKYDNGLPTLGKTFLAARLFSVEPTLLGDECRKSGNQSLCEAEAELKIIKTLPGNKNRRDLFWDVKSRMGGRFDMVDFERNHALPIVWDGMTGQPVRFAGIILQDWLSFYLPRTRFDFRATLGEPMPTAYYTSLQSKGMMQSSATRDIATGLRYAFYITLAFGLFTARKILSSSEWRWSAAILLLCLANDLLFAIVSGPPDRYHHRILPVAALVALLALARALEARRKAESHLNPGSDEVSP